MEELKPLNEIFAPDFRTTCRGYTLEILHKLAAAHELLPSVPGSVRHQFEIARHSYIFAWLYTPLCAAAELYAILAVEHALRIRFRASPRAKNYSNEPGLKTLLRIAGEEGWITDAGFDIDYREPVLTDQGIDYRPIPLEQRRKPTEIVLDVLPDIRNEIAHGQPTMTLETVTESLKRATEIINQLFPANS